MAATGSPRRPWMAAIAGLVTMALGLGVYAVLGQPAIALSSLTGPSQTDYPALITMLARRMPDARRVGPAPWKPILGMSGPTSLPVEFGPRR